MREVESNMYNHFYGAKEELELFITACVYVSTE